MSATDTSSREREKESGTREREKKLVIWERQDGKQMKERRREHAEEKTGTPGTREKKEG